MAPSHIAELRSLLQGFHSTLFYHCFISLKCLFGGKNYTTSIPKGLFDSGVLEGEGQRGGSIVIFKPLVQFLGGEGKGAKSLLVPLFASPQIGFYGGEGRGMKMCYLYFN